MQNIEESIDAIPHKIECWREFGYERIANLCTHIVKCEDGVFEKMRCWNTCAFTGIVTPDVLQIRHGNRVLHIHPMFEQFAVSL